MPLPSHAYLTASPAIAGAVLVEQGAAVERSTIDRRLLGTLLGDGLLMSREPRHRRQRKLLAPAFTPTHVQSYGALMAEEVPVHPVMEVTLRPSPFEVLVHRRDRRLG